MDMPIRSYQKKLIDDLRLSLKHGHKNVLIQSPAGSGKSITMAELAKRITSNGERVLFVVHRRELVKQIKILFFFMGSKYEFVRNLYGTNGIEKIRKSL